MPDRVTMERITEARGASVHDADGDKIGVVEEIFYDRDTGQPEWVGIGTGFFGTKRVLVPLDNAQMTDDGLRVPYSKDFVKDAPDVDADEISEQTEQELYSYYQLRTRTGRSRRRAEGGKQEITRSEEEVQVGKRQVDAGGVRLHKWVETEPVDVEVELQRETARVTREQIDRPAPDAELGEEEIEVPLHGEEPVAQKRTVAKERVGVAKDVRTDKQTISDEVRKERVDVEGDVKER